ncbi:hypothetical protein GCM10018790_64870 [Kitasatospora xanthocidica]|uniref:nSTAND1 domain-containing NTPase n=1 Tax=Kitasatospora xanthocidica TaxID=83382 RepID=UPI0016719A4E|nr:NACHT and WD repeat domain-containing protein [Kitasatospora xanthocidica]GHF77774.1 hypothetical protein GCM10018790_64870 [Kitasatospora xanthocidica]
MRAAADNGARIFQSGRDMVVAEAGDVHLHYLDGVRETRRAPVDAAADCPYPGLKPFETDDARWFFGRDDLVAQVLAELDRDAEGPLVIVAPSGAGKSSLLRAGVLPALAAGRLPGSADWSPLLLTPTERPVDELTALLERAVGVTAAELRRAIEAGSDAVASALRASPGTSRLLLVVDQLEELFTLCTDEPQRHAFLDLLDALAAGPEPAALVVCTLRSDFYSRCVTYPPLRSALQHRQILVGPLSQENLREAILFPAREVGLILEPGLVELMLADLGGPGQEAGRLPLLAHALRAVWHHRHGNTLTVSGYRTTGGIGQAVATSAERIYSGLDPAGQTAAQAMFLRLVRIGESTAGAEDTRRRVARSDLPVGLVELFTIGRLLTVEHDTVTIAHEALLRAWPRMRTWIESDRADQLVRQGLEEAAAAWERDGRDPGMLYRGERLAAARLVAHEAGPLATAFLTASAHRARRAAARRNRVIAVLSALSLVAVAAAAIAVRQSLTARSERDTAVFHQILAKADHLRGTDPSLAAQLDLAAYRMRQADPEAYTRLVNDAASTLSTALAHRNPVDEVVFSPDGRLLAGVGLHGALELWDTTEPRHPASRTDLLPGLDTGVLSAAFSPDGKLLAAGGEGYLRLWDVTDPAGPKAGATLRTNGATDAIAFSPDGGRLAAGDGKQVRVWDLAVPSSPAPLGEPLGQTGLVTRLRFGREGNSLVVGVPATDPADAAVRVWDLTGLAAASTPRSTALGMEGEPTVSWFGMSPDGKEVAVAAGSGTVHRWDIGNPAAPAPLGEPLSGHGGIPESLAYSPDGHTLAVAGDDRTIRLWDITDRARPKPLGTPLPGSSPTSGPLPSDRLDNGYELVFSPDSTTLAAAGEDGTVRLWNVALPEHITPLGNPLIGHGDAVRSLTFGPDGTTLATAGMDSTVRLWSLPGSRLVQQGDPTGNLSISSDGELLAVRSEDGRPGIRILRTTPAGTRDRTEADHRFKDAWSAVFSPAGRTLAAATTDQTIRLWDMRDPASPRAVGSTTTRHKDAINQMVFSPDGGALFTNDQTSVRLWNVKDPASPKALATLIDLADQAAYDYGVGIGHLALSADGALLAVETREGAGKTNVRLWDVRDPARPRPVGTLSDPLGAVESGPPVSVTSLALAGTTLILGDQDGRLHLWDVGDPTRPRSRGPAVTAHAVKVTSLALEPQGKTLATSGEDHTVRLWDISDISHPRPLGTPLTGHAGPVTALAYSPDGRHLVTTSRDGTVQLRALSPDDLSRIVCDTTWQALTRTSWENHLPGIPYEPPC